MATTITIGERVRELATLHPDRAAVVAVAPGGTQRVLTWAELEERSNRAAHCLGEHGVDDDGVVAVALPSGFDHVVATLGAWKQGALVVPIDAEMAAEERSAVLEAMPGGFVVGDAAWAKVSPEAWRTGDYPAEPPSLRGDPRSASLTGGTTGKPRIVVREKTWRYPAGALLSEADRATAIRMGQVQLVMLPMYHAGFTGLHHGLVLDHTIVLMETFVPDLFPRLVEEHRVNFFRIVPTQMRAILEVPDLHRYDLSSVEAVNHGSAPCPEPVKRAWLQLFDPEKIFEDYSMVERLGVVTIRGDEWLRHPGSVGKPRTSEVRIVAADGRAAEPGEVGEVFLRSGRAHQPTYLGEGPSLVERDGFYSVGDMGYLDEEGYLYLLDRKTNVINVGGVNVYPAEVEEALLSFSGVADAAAIARPHEYLGEAVHALVVAPEGLDQTALDVHCRALLSMAKVPLSYELVDSIPRTRAGKISRQVLSATSP